MEGVLGVGLEEVHLISVCILSPRTQSWPQMSTGGLGNVVWLCSQEEEEMVNSLSLSHREIVLYIL